MRQTWAQHQDTLIINAARVPHIEAGGTRRHHIRLVIDADKARAETRWLDAAGHCVAREPLGPTPS